MILVVLAHAGVPGVTGGFVGVDVFFVISGFLITTLLVKELDRSGRISLPAFYARRALRLLPAAAVVLLATLAAAWLWLPATRFGTIAGDALAGVYYGINWRLAAAGTDYLNATAPPSPLQHLWSLAVEEQFYLVWPLLLLAVALLRRGRSLRVPLIALLSLIAAGSLAFSVHQSASAAPWAYFGTHTRAHELAVGGLAALAAPRLARASGVAWKKAATWAGLAAILAAAFLYGETTAFPGLAALLPVAGAAAVILGGTPGAPGGAGSALGLRPFQQVGKLSYGWYLWHWPVLLIGPVALGRAPSLRLGLALAAGSLLLALVSHHLVENPVRHQPRLKARNWRALALGAALTAVTGAAALVAIRLPPPLPTGSPAPSLAAELERATDPQRRLTELITAAAGRPRLPKDLTPSLTGAADDLPALYADECHSDYEPTRQDRPCGYGDPGGSVSAFLVGDSHAASWFPAIDRAARARGIRLTAVTKAACQVPSVLTWNVPLKRPYRECVSWRDQVFARIRAERPDVVVLASNDLDNGGLIDAAGNRVSTAGHADDAAWVAAWESSFERLTMPGTKLVLLQDSPWPKGDAPECLATHAERVTACYRRAGRSVVEPARRTAVAAAARARGVEVVNPLAWFCTDVCPVVIADTLVFKDNSHLTATFAAALAPVVGPVVFG